LTVWKPHELPSRTKRILAGVIVLAALAGAVGLAPAAHSAATLDAEVSVVEAVPNGQPDRLTVRVANTGDETIDPHVSTWRADRKFVIYWGEVVVPPGEARTVQLTAANTTLEAGERTHLAINDGERRASTAFRPVNGTEVADGRD
jgi:hypothetical protein